MKAKIVLIMVAVFLIGNNRVQAENKVFTENGVIVEGDVWDTVYVINDTTVVDMWGGTVGDLYAQDSSTVNIYSGEIIGAREVPFEKGLGAWYSSTVNIFGGYFCEITAFDSGTMQIHGGVIDFIWGESTSAPINIYGFDLILTEIGGEYDDGIVSGRWVDDNEFSIDLYSNAYNQIILHEIPEPCTGILLCLGAFYVVIFKAKANSEVIQTAK
jgi:hypothetical protein